MVLAVFQGKLVITGSQGDELVYSGTFIPYNESLNLKYIPGNMPQFYVHDIYIEWVFFTLWSKVELAIFS